MPSNKGPDKRNALLDRFLCVRERETPLLRVLGFAVVAALWCCRSSTGDAGPAEGFREVWYVSMELSFVVVVEDVLGAEVAVELASAAGG